ncbi:MAG: Ig-like domain-containing protein, partial [Planctomycetota bacterium]
MLDRLEPRVMLDSAPAAHVFARLEGQVQAGAEARVAIHLRPEDFAPARTGKTMLGLHLQAAEGSGLDPDVVEALSNGQPVNPRYARNDTGVTDSLALVEFLAGDYELAVRGQGNTGGAYVLDVFLVGDVEGDGDVDRADTRAIRGMYGRSTAQAGIEPTADANLDGVVSSFDVAQHIRNLGAATSITVLSLAAGISPAPTATLPDGTPLTADPSPSIAGVTAPGATVELDLDGDGFDDGSATADAAGSFALATTLVEGVNALQVRARDAFGQEQTATLSVALDTVRPLIASAPLGVQRRAPGSLLVSFTEAMGTGAGNAGSYRLADTGGNELTVTSVQLFGVSMYQLSLAADLPDGDYQLSIDASLADLAGNALDGEVVFDFSVA